MLAGSSVLVLELEGRCATDNPQARHLGQPIEHLLGDPIGKILLIFLLAEIKKRQHGDGLIADDGRSGCLRLFRGDVLRPPELVREDVGKADRRNGERSRHDARPPPERRFAWHRKRHRTEVHAGSGGAGTEHLPSAVAAVVAAHGLDECRENLLDGTARRIQPLVRAQEVFEIWR